MRSKTFASARSPSAAAKSNVTWPCSEEEALAYHGTHLGKYHGSRVFYDVSHCGVLRLRLNLPRYSPKLQRAALSPHTVCGFVAARKENC